MFPTLLITWEVLRVSEKRAALQGSSLRHVLRSCTQGPGWRPRGYRAGSLLPERALPPPRDPAVIYSTAPSSLSSASDHGQTGSRTGDRMLPVWTRPCPPIHLPLRVPDEVETRRSVSAFKGKG